MLTKKQNMLETIRGGHPDRYVNQYEALQKIIGDPYDTQIEIRAPKGGGPVQDGWGVWLEWPESQPGTFPIHDAEHILCPDITEWRKYIKLPRMEFTKEEWAPAIEASKAIDRDEYFATVFFTPGIFEHLHYFQGMTDALCNYLAEPEATSELIEFLTDYELAVAEQMCEYLHPTALFHHDDWGSELSTFIAPELFAELYVPAYKKIYGYYKDHGVEIVCHHSDSYAATLVPYMIEMGIDVWQGVMRSNNIPEMMDKWKGQITFMGGIDSKLVDYEGWTPEVVDREFRVMTDQFGPESFIPCITQGGPSSTFPGVYQAGCDALARINHEKFGIPLP